MTFRRTSVVLSSLTGVAMLLVGAAAQAAGVMEVYRLARENDPRWRAAGFELQATSETVNQARAALLPTITLDFEHVQTEQKILSSNNPIFGVGNSRFPTDSRVLTLTQPIFRAASWARLSQAKAVVKQAAAANAAAEQDLMLRVAAAYLGVLAARDGVALAAAEREAVGRHLELAQARLDRGLGTIANLYDARARFTVTQAREIEARNKLQDAGQALREIAGRVVEGLRPLREDIPLTPPDPATVEQWLTVAENQNLRLESRRQAAEVAAEEVRRQRGGHAPSLTLVGTNSNRRAGGTVFGGGSHTDTTDFALRLSIPILEGGATTSLTREAALRRSKALEEVDFEWRQLERQTRAAFQGVQSGISLVNALRDTVVAQEKAVETKEEGRRAGMTTLLPVLDAQRDLYFARRDYAQARYDYLMNRLRLKEAAGTLSEQDLAAIEMMLQQ